MPDDVLRGILDKLEYGIAVVLKDKLIYANQKLLDIFGYTKEEIDQNTIMAYIDPEEKKRIETIINEIENHGIPPKKLEYWIIRKDGTRRFIRDYFFEIKENGNLEGQFTLTEDITEELKKETVVFASELKKSRFLDFLSELIVFHDANQKIIWANKAASDSLDLTPEQLVGRQCFELWHQSDQPCEFCPVLKAKESGHEEIAEITTPDKRRWSIRGYPVYDDNGKLIGLAELTREITKEKLAEEKLKESEESYRKLIETSPDGIFSFDINGDITFANQRVLDIFNLNNSNEFVGKNVFVFVSQEDLLKAQKTLKKTLEEGSVRNAEIQFYRKDGLKIPIELSTSMIQDSEGIASGYISVVRDISDRKFTEKTLRDNEEKFRQIFHSANDAIFIHKLTKDGRFGKFIEINNVACRWTDYEREELLNLTPIDIDNPKFRMKNVNVGKELLTTGSTTYESEIVNKEGNFKPVEISSHLFLLKDEVVILSIARDITDRKKSEKALKDSEEKFRQIFQNANDGIFLTKLIGENETSKFIEVNDIACELLGYSREELLELKSIDITAHHAKEFNFNIIQEIVDRGSGRFETVLVSKDGHNIPVELSSHFFYLREDKVILSIARDITERKNSDLLILENEEKYRTLFHNANDIIAVIHVPGNNTIGTILDLNDLALTKLGYNREEVIGRGANFLVENMSEEEVDNLYLDIVEKNTLTIERNLIKKDGSLLPVEIKATPFILKKQDAVLITARDITDRKIDEELKVKAFTQIDQNIENFEKLVDRIRNPLMAIIGYTELSDFNHKEIIIQEANKIDEITKLISKSWVESEEFREILRKQMLLDEARKSNQEKNEKHEEI